MGSLQFMPPLWLRFLRKFGFGGMAWTLRKFSMPIKRSFLVLEVGAGDHPFPLSDIIVDKFEESKERYGNLLFDRPTFIFEGENLPFRDKAFDFVIAAQVLEHSKQPEQFLKELQRVARRGYIETPDAVIERLAPMPFHLSEITERNGRLIIRKKHSWNIDEDIEELWKYRLMWSKPVRKMVRKYPELFNVCYLWENTIDYDIVNPDAPAFTPPSWQEVKSRSIEAQPQQSRKIIRSVFWNPRKIKRFIEKCIMWAYSQRRKQPDYISILRCISCNSTDFKKDKESLICNHCKNTYSVRGNYIKPLDRKSVD